MTTIPTRPHLITRQSRFLALAFALALTTAPPGLPPVHGQTGDRSDIDVSTPPEHWDIPEAPVRSPEDSMALFELPAGFRVELVAAEPLVQDPVMIAFDERGRLWVLEWPDYNRQLRGLVPGLEEIDPPKGRVVVLEDLDGDGAYDQRTVFMDGIDWPRGLQVVRGGALVLKLPQLVLALDRDGDGVADHEEVIVDGLEIPANSHGAANSLFLAMDNTVYSARLPLRLRRAGEGWETEPHLHLLGQWGLGHDDFGRLVYATNGDHLRGSLFPGSYFLRNPNYPATAGADMSLASDQRTWPHAATPGTNRRSQQRDEDGTLHSFTANTHPTVYRGDQFPPKYRGDAFLGEAAGRFLRRSVLREEDGVLSGANAYEESEFLFSHDERFRPVHSALGPDGGLYVADMYRGIIEGHLFITTYLREQIVARGLQHPFAGLGRIYRIVHEDGVATPPPAVDPEDPASWLPALAHPNGFWRDTAQRLLVESGEAALAPALREMASGHEDERARIHALWTLEGLGAVDSGVLTAAFADVSFRVRESAARLSESFLDDGAVFARLLSLAEDERIEVRRQALFSLGETGEATSEAALEAMAVLLRRDAAGPFVVEAALSGLHGREWILLGRLLDDPEWRDEAPGASRALAALAHAIMNADEIDELDELLARLGDEGGTPAWQRDALLGGLAEARRRGLASLPESLVVLEGSSEASVKEAAAALRRSWSTAPAMAASASDQPSNPEWDRGQRLYVICGACHGAEGQGQPSIAPPLVESPVVEGPVEELIRAVLFGRNQDRTNPDYPDMPPLSGLDDIELASLVFYVKARWGGDATPVEPEAVQALRGTGE